jgi:cell division protein FtsZ
MEQLDIPEPKFAPLNSTNISKFSFIAEPDILAIGCGGAGNNCINRIQSLNLAGATTIAINTDKQHLELIEADKKILIGREITRGLGVGGDPRLAMKCVDVSRHVIEEIIGDAELVFMVAGMGGGTGTGIAPLIAEIAKKHGAIVVGIATTPFKMERLRTKIAKVGLLHLRRYSNSLIILDNNKLVQMVPKLSMDKAFGIIDNLIAEIINGITETITQPSLINLDFADVKAIMSKGDIATLMFGEGTIANADLIIKNSLKHPLLETNCKGAVGALIHITGGSRLSLKMVQEITAGITGMLDERANIIMGASVRPEYGKRVKVLTIMTGLKPPKMLCPIDEEPHDSYRDSLPRPDFSRAMFDDGIGRYDDFRMPR